MHIYIYGDGVLISNVLKSIKINPEVPFDRHNSTDTFRRK